MNGDERLRGRAGEIWLAYVVARETQTSIAKRYGISPQRVSQIIAEAKAEVGLETREQHLEKALAAADFMLGQLAPLVTADPVPLYSNGKPVRDANGDQVPDHSHRLAALDRMVKVHERVARLTGIDAAQKTESVVTVEDTTVQQKAAEAAARLAGRKTDPP